MDPASSTPALEQIEEELRAAYAAGSIEDEDGRPRPIAPDGVTVEQGSDIAALVAGVDARRTIEVGFALGLSCLHICAGLLRGSGDEGRHMAIDPTEEPHWRNAGRQLVEHAGADKMVRLLEEESQVALPRLLREGAMFDFGFVDGDHRFDPTLIDIYFMTRIVRPGGLIVVDDTWMPAVRLAVAFFETNLGLELLPDAGSTAFHWTARRPLSRGVPPGQGHMAVLRQPDPPVDRAWDHFERFW
jgi:predicted O-methyltransferase YrrM